MSPAPEPELSFTKAHSSHRSQLTIICLLNKYLWGAYAIPVSHQEYKSEQNYLCRLPSGRLQMSGGDRHSLKNHQLLHIITNHDQNFQSCDQKILHKIGMINHGQLVRTIGSGKPGHSNALMEDSELERSRRTQRTNPSRCSHSSLNAFHHNLSLQIFVVD